MRYRINLATRIHLDHRLLNRSAYIAIFILLLVFGWNVSRVASNVGEQSRMKEEIAVIQSKLAAKPIGVPDAEAGRQKNLIRFYNEIIGRKSMNWLSLLDLFESVTPEGISLSSLSPGKDHEEWKLSGRARSFKDVQKYLEKLDASKKFSDILLLSHQKLTAGNSERGVQFSISCRVLN